MTAYVLLAFAIAAEVVGTSALKASDGMSRAGPAALVLGAYAAAFYFMALALRTLPVGFVYAIWAGLGIVGVALIGAVWFGEAFTPLKVAGIVLVIGGVVLIKAGSP